MILWWGESRGDSSFICARIAWGEHAYQSRVCVRETFAATVARMRYVLLLAVPWEVRARVIENEMSGGAA
jgi:hypothetical protein